MIQPRHYVFAQTALLALWLALNVAGELRHWNPWGLILLNLMYVVQATYAAPLFLHARPRESAGTRSSSVHGALELQREEVDRLRREVTMLRRALADKVGREELEMAVRRPLADSRGNRDEPLRPNPRRLDA